MIDESRRRTSDTAEAESVDDVEDGAEIAADEPVVEESRPKKVRKTETADDDAEPAGLKSSRQLSISLRSLVIAVVIVALIGGVGVMTWLYVDAKRQVDADARRTADYAHAEQIALDYATNAAAMNFQDIPAWKNKLVAGTSPELGKRLGSAADQMQQILVPLQWTSTARPLAAKVRSTAGSGYTVDAFVSVLTKTVQGPEPLQSTATYSVTVDSGRNWQITDVGGIDAAVKGP